MISARMLGIWLVIILSTTIVCGSRLRVETTTADINSSFTVDIVLEPTEPIKAYEFKIDYDPALIIINSIDYGDFFDGYQTFNSPDMVNIYSLIIGKGNITTSGVVVTLNITAISVGTTEMGLIGAGICNETRYLPLEIDNGTITITNSIPPVQPEPPELPPDVPELPPEPPEQKPIPPMDEPIAPQLDDVHGHSDQYQSIQDNLIVFGSIFFIISMVILLFKVVDRW